MLKELFIRCRKLNISLCFLAESYFSVSKHVRLNCTHYIIFKLNNKRELQNIAGNPILSQCQFKLTVSFLDVIFGCPV